MTQLDPPNQDLQFARPGGGLLLIKPEPLAVLMSYRQLSSADLEAGGVLLGRYLLDNDDVIVDQATVPGPRDKRSRFGFFRHKHWHQAHIQRAWEESNHTTTWLGEWHTHPEAYPTPSWVDKRDWRRRLRKDQYEEVLFFLIVGIEAIHAWEGNSGNKHIIELQETRVDG